MNQPGIACLSPGRSTTLTRCFVVAAVAFAVAAITTVNAAVAAAAVAVSTLAAAAVAVTVAADDAAVVIVGKQKYHMKTKSDWTTYAKLRFFLEYTCTCKENCEFHQRGKNSGDYGTHL